MAQKKHSQHIRSTQKIAKAHEHLSAHNQEFPKDKTGVIYVRQSTIAQVRKNLHSYEMQTNEFVKFFREKKGVTSHIEIVADDEGKSGSLDIHDRPGLERVMRLIEGKELLKGERIGWVGAVNVTRLTRDKWLVVPGTLMRACAEHDVWISTLRMDFNFADDYSRRVFVLEAEEAAKYLEWQKEVLQGGRLVASNKGVYDGRHVAYGYVVDYREKLEDGEPNPTFKKYLVYEPHAKVVKWIFRRYLELDGNFTALCREVDKMPYLFPAFERGVDSRWITRCAGGRIIFKEGPHRGCFKPTRSGLASLLTNPVYIGWWIPQGGGLLEKHHPATIDQILFSYAHRRLSSYNLQGTRTKPQRATRNGKTQALLKKLLISPLPEHRIYSAHTKDLLYYVLKYVGAHTHRTLLHVRTDLLDKEFTLKFFERMQGWVERGELDSWKERTEEEHALAQLGREKRKDTLSKEIAQAKARRQEIMDTLSDPDIPKTKAMKIDYAVKVAGLEAKADELQKELEAIPEEEEEEAVILYQIWDLLPQLQNYWEKLPCPVRMSAIGAFVRRAVLEHPSPLWIKITFEWKIGECDVMHIRRVAGATSWSEKEDTIIKEYWPKGDILEILRMLPDRSRTAISSRAENLQVRRRTTQSRSAVQAYESMSMHDVRYAEENQLVDIGKKVYWSRTIR